MAIGFALVQFQMLCEYEYNTNKGYVNKILLTYEYLYVNL